MALLTISDAQTGPITDAPDGLLVTETGSITSTGGLNGGPPDYDGAGISLNSKTVSGSIVNEGTITTDLFGIATLATDTATTISGDIKNSGTINADFVGITVDGSDIGGKIINDGTISMGSGVGSSQPVGILLNNSPTQLENNGEINASGGFGLLVSGNGVEVQDVVNTGTINAGSIRIGGTDSEGNGTDFFNTGTLRLDSSNIGEDSASNQFTIYSEVSGDFTSSVDGNAPDTLIEFTLTQLWVDTTSPFGLLDIGEDAYFGGTLSLDFDEGLTDTFSLGDSFTLIRVGGEIISTFDNTNNYAGAAFGANDSLRFELSYTETTVLVTVVSFSAPGQVAEPSTAALSLLMLGALACKRLRTRR